VRSRGLLLVLLSIAGLAAWNPPLAAQSGPVQKVLEEVTGSGASQDKPSEGEDQGGKQGVLPEKPPESILARKDLLEPNAWARLAEEMVGSFVRWLPSLLTAILILCVFFILYRLAAGLLGRLMNRTRADPAARDIAVRLTRYAILAIGLMMAASQLGIQVGSLLAGVGIIGLALGLAAQDSLANLVAGITILWDRPFRIGDNVTVSGTFGKVKEIGLRTTRIRTVEHLDAILPNKEIINAKIVNHTLSPMMRRWSPSSPTRRSTWSCGSGCAIPTRSGRPRSPWSSWPRSHSTRPASRSRSRSARCIFRDRSPSFRPERSAC